MEVLFTWPKYEFALKSKTYLLGFFVDLDFVIFLEWNEQRVFEKS